MNPMRFDVADLEDGVRRELLLKIDVALDHVAARWGLWRIDDAQFGCRGKEWRYREEPLSGSAGVCDPSFVVSRGARYDLELQGVIQGQDIVDARSGSHNGLPVAEGIPGNTDAWLEVFGSGIVG